MGLLATAFRPEARALNESEWLLRALSGGASTYTGRQVGPADALRFPAVYACVHILADSIASLPLITYRRLEGGGKERADGHRLYPLLHDAPNPEMTAMEWRQTMTAHRALWGNAYSEIEFDNAGRVVGLWPLRPDRMQVQRDRGTKRLVYRYTLDNEQVELRSEQVFHWRGLAPDGIYGYSPIGLAREAVGLGLATEEYAARFFGNDATPGGVLEVKGKLSEAAQRNLKASWEASHRGLDKAQRIAVLEEGVTWKSIGMPARDAQFLEQRKYQVNEIARIFRVPLHMVADLDRATFANIEHQGLEFVVHTLRSYLVSFEQRANNQLLSSDHRGTYFVEHLVDGLLRGDTRARYGAYAVGWNRWLVTNEIRAAENLNPLPGGDDIQPLANIVGKGATPPPGGGGQTDKGDG